MPISKQVTENTWFIGCDTNYEIIHYSFVPENTQLDSGQEIIELFYNEQDYINRLLELGIEL